LLIQDAKLVVEKALNSSVSVAAQRANSRYVRCTTVVSGWVVYLRVQDGVAVFSELIPPLGITKNAFDRRIV
jgi:hypothetical protein